VVMLDIYLDEPTPKISDPAIQTSTLKTIFVNLL
jgi:hypothetical protein